MALVTEITALQVTAKQPIDEKLMQAIRDDLYGLEADIVAAGAFDYQFKVNGYLAQLRANDGSFAARHRLDGAMISKNTTFSQCRILLEQTGNGGTLEVDVRRYTNPNVAIQSLLHLFTDAITGISQRGSGLSTQSIARTTAQIATQSISRWKTQLNVLSIVLLGNGLVQYNLSGTPDADFVVADTFTAASCTTSANNGTFAIVRVNNNGGSNLVVQNASGVAQATAAGTMDLDAWKFVYTNPVSAQFVAGESATMASHTTGANNGTFPIYAINQVGNNIIFKGSAFVAQGSAAGTADTNRWAFALSASAPSYIAVGESIATTSHTTGGNNGTLPVVAVNSGGNNICVYNASGAVQGGAAGTINSLRWIYSFASDPTTSSNVQVGDSVWTLDATSAANRGQLVAKELNVSSALNIVVYNAAGVAQVSSGGNMFTNKMAVKFAADQSSYMTTASKIRLHNVSINSQVPGFLDGEYDVAQVNRGGGSNYNAVVSMYGAPAIPGPMGRVPYESKSLFTTRPSITIAQYDGVWGAVSTNAVFDATQKVVPANTLVMASLLQIPTGDPKNCTIQML